MFHHHTKLLVLGICVVYMAALSNSAVIRDKAIRQKRTIPNWSMSASDFHGWVEELQRLGAYDKSKELARIYWAHFPIASQLGYDVPEDQDYDA
ncbi:hypothetical protein GDO86_003865 [Hymenochirus boettgeri]|uniref:Uncharacterized protein n=1 Tax=Hymenochirus boettgeri TaxID=247094 RepID=A0A8T2K7N8_9PIPI|nr:hypothetical protein GDO86_003865 [Hymenochirus boettgeri]